MPCPTSQKTLEAEIELETAIAEAVKAFERKVRRRVVEIIVHRYEGRNIQIEATTNTV